MVQAGGGHLGQGARGPWRSTWRDPSPAQNSCPRISQAPDDAPRSQPAGRRGRTAVSAGSLPTVQPPGDGERLPGRQAGITGTAGGSRPPAAGTAVPPAAPPSTAPSTPLLRSLRAPCSVCLWRCPEIIWQRSRARATSTHRST